MEMMDIQATSQSTYTKNDSLYLHVVWERMSKGEEERQRESESSQVNGLNDVGGVLYVSCMKHEQFELSDIKQNFMQIKKAQYTFRSDTRCTIHAMQHSSQMDFFFEKIKLILTN